MADCSSYCDGRRPEGLVRPGRGMKPDSELGALFALKAHLEAMALENEEVGVRAGLPSREAARMLLGGLAEVVRRTALA